MNDELAISIQKDLDIMLPAKITMEELQEKLASHINQLINNNFQQLILILYRVDINETKLKKILKDNPGKNAGGIIAQLIIERQLQKIKTRNEWRHKNQNDDSEERW